MKRKSSIGENKEMDDVKDRFGDEMKDVLKIIFDYVLFERAHSEESDQRYRFFDVIF